MWNAIKYVMRELEIRPVHGHQSTKFSSIYKRKSNTANNHYGIDTDRVVVRSILCWRYVDRRKSERCSVEMKGNDQV